MAAIFSLYNDVAIFKTLLLFCDLSVLRVFAQLNPKDWRRVRDEMERRVMLALLTFFAPADIGGFVDVLYDNGGCVFGHVAQQVAAPGSGAGLVVQRRHLRCCDSGEDLNIMVHGLDGLKKCVRWLLTKRYILWSGTHVIDGRLTSKTDYVVGYTQESISRVCVSSRFG